MSNQRDAVQARPTASVAPTVVFVLKGYPRLSETFIAQEIRELERRGLRIAIVSLRHPTDHASHPVHAEIEAPVNYLPEYLHHEPWRVLRAWWRLRSRPGYAEAVARLRRDFARDRSRNRLRRFGQALVLAAELDAEVVHLHAHFLHTPASVTRYAAVLCGLPWSASAHAKDIWTSSSWDLEEKLAECAWTVTCTETNYRHLSALAAVPDKVQLVYHGLDLDRFPGPEPVSAEVSRPVQLLSVGRAVVKKGYDVLLNALARLPADIDWTFIHVGGGELLQQLAEQAEALGIAERITWLGACAQDEVLKQYRQADVFVLASRIAADGDRDGLPNVLMEAQSQRLACVSTRISAIPELIQHEVTGLLVEPDDADALSATLGRVMSDGRLRAQLADAGHRRVHEVFSLRHTIEPLVKRFEPMLKAAGQSARESA